MSNEETVQKALDYVEGKPVHGEDLTMEFAQYIADAFLPYPDEEPAGPAATIIRELIRKAYDQNGLPHLIGMGLGQHGVLMALMDPEGGIRIIAQSKKGDLRADVMMTLLAKKVGEVVPELMKETGRVLRGEEPKS